MPLSIKKGQKVQVIVENQGRICFGAQLKDFKGLVSNVTLNARILHDWKMLQLPLIDQIIGNFSETQRNFSPKNNGAMTFWHGQFKLPCKDKEAKDTFLRYILFLNILKNAVFKQKLFHF